MNKCEVCGEILNDNEKLVCTDDKFMMLLDEDMRDLYITDYRVDFNAFLKEYYKDIRTASIEFISEKTSLSVCSLNEISTKERTLLLAEILYINEDITHYIQYYLSERRKK